MTYLLEEFQKVLNETPKKLSIVYRIKGEDISLNLEQVNNLSLSIDKHFVDHNIEKQECVGLLMDHNIYIPSLILR